MTRYYVVAAYAGALPEAEVWTISRDPRMPGWSTDGGYPGYGLRKAEAQFLVDAANAALDAGAEAPGEKA